MAELSQQLQDPLDAGQVIINIRAETPPETLREAVELALKRCGEVHPEVIAKVEHLEFFQPGRPQPTHRFTRA